MLARLNQVVVMVGEQTTDEQWHSALSQQAKLTTETVERTVPLAHDRETIRNARERYAEPGAAPDRGGN